MGVTKGSESLYHLRCLSRADCAAIMRGTYEERRAANELKMSQPTIDGDSNNICHIVARKSENKSSSVVSFYQQWAHCGLQVAPLVDGDVRPTCKQATNERIASREKARIHAHILMKEVHELKRNISSGLYSSPEELAKMKQEVFKKEKQSRSKLSQSVDLMPVDFADALEDVLVNDLCVRTPNNTGGFVAPVLKAKFQADAAIIGRFDSGETLMAITNDSDIPILAGGAFVALKDYKTDGKMTMVSTSKSTLEKAMGYLPEQSKDYVKLEDAVCPIFENVDSRKMRALMMVALGCDVYKPGVKGIGPKKLSNTASPCAPGVAKTPQRPKKRALANSHLNNTDSTLTETPKRQKVSRDCTEKLKKRGWDKLPTRIPARSMLPVPKKKPERHSYCSRLGCKVTNLTHPHTSFHRIKANLKPLSANAPRSRYIDWEGKRLLRKEILDRCHFKRNVKGGAYRVCEEHKFEWVVRSATFTWKGKEITQPFNLYVPKGEGSKSTMCQKTKDSRGNTVDRMIRQQLVELNEQIGKRPNKPFVCTVPQQLNQKNSRRNQVAVANSNAAAALADAAESRKAVLQMAEETSPDSREIKMNPSVAREAGLPFDERYSPPAKTPNKTFFNCSARPTSTTPSKKSYAASKPPTLTPGTTDAEIKRRTDFSAEALMLSFIVALCGGDAELIRRRSSSLTWYEEWVFHFEWKYGRTFTRWEDATKALGPDEKTLWQVVRQKLALERRAHRLWPKFASYEEDCSLRKPKWELKYRERNGVNTRPIMWDMTGIKAYQFGAADLQRDTYSKYYAGNCFKGGIFTQLCGWGGVHDLWGGNVSDSNYNEMAGYLDKQEEFQRNDKVDGQVVPFTNIYDKGYRARAVCWRKGRQLTAQPVYAKSDQRFKDSDTLLSASIASDRGGNERYVNVSKRSGIIKRGFKAGMDAHMFQDMWITWAFQANFMYNPVL